MHDIAILSMKFFLPLFQDTYILFIEKNKRQDEAVTTMYRLDRLQAMPIDFRFHAFF